MALTITDLSDYFDNVPTIQDPDNFEAYAGENMVDLQNMFGSSGDIHTFITEANALAAEVETNTSDAESAKTDAESAQTAAETAQSKAEDWAEEDENVEVEAGKYSAKHWSKKAESSVLSDAQVWTA